LWLLSRRPPRKHRRVHSVGRSIRNTSNSTVAPLSPYRRNDQPCSSAALLTLATSSGSIWASIHTV